MLREKFPLFSGVEFGETDTKVIEVAPSGLPSATESPDLAKEKLIANERVKLTATALNNGAVAALITSLVGPAASDLYGIVTPQAPYWWAFGLAWMILALTLHFVARKILGGLKP